MKWKVPVWNRFFPMFMDLYDIITPQFTSFNAFNVAKQAYRVGELLNDIHLAASQKEMVAWSTKL